MTGPRRAAVERIFLAVVNDPGNRDAILRDQCGGDAGLRDEVVEFLDHHAPDSFLDPDALRLAEAALEEPALPPGTRIGSYVLDAVLGRGGMGVVYVARQERPRRTVALKLIRRVGSGPARRRRFEREAELLGRLQHPGVAQIFEAGMAELATPEGPVTQPFLAMELIAGRPLTEHVRHAGLGRAERILLMVKVCAAVDHAHQRGIVHRDLKPANILVDATGQPKVLDFGVARATGADEHLSSLHTHQGQLIGTLSYMSPEQVAGQPEAVDARADVYALGCLLYEVLTGAPPLDLTNLPLPEAARRILDHEPAPLSAHDRSLKGGLQAIAAQALAKDREHRYATAAGLAADLTAFLAGRPIAAGGISALELLTRRMRRYRGIVVAGALASLVLLVVAGFALHQASANRELARRVEVELAASNLERGRLLGRSGNLALAEDLLWREHVAASAPRQTLWALWELYLREACRATFQAHDGTTVALALSADGRTLATGGTDGRLRLWDVTSAQVRSRGTFLPGAGTVREVLFASDEALVVAGEAGAVLLVDAVNGTVRRRYAGLAADVSGLALVAGGQSLAAGATDGVVCVWDLAWSEPRARHDSGHRGVFALRCSPDGTLLATAHEDGQVLIYRRGGVDPPVPLSAPNRGARALGFGADADTLVVGGPDRTLSAWDLAGNRCVRSVETTSGTVRWVQPLRDGTSALTSGYWSADVWDLQSGQRLRTMPGGVANTCLSRDESLLALATINGTVRLWDFAGAGWRHPLTAAGAPHTGRTVARPSRDGRLLLSGDEQGTARVWETASGRCLASWPAHERRVHAVRLDPTGRYAATAGLEGAVNVWDLTTGRRRIWIPQGNARTSDAVDWSPDGQRFAHCTPRGGFEIREVRDGSVCARLPDAPAEALSVRFLPDGGSLLVVRRNEPPRLWTPGREPLELPGGPDATWSLDVSEDGTRVALGTWGQAIRIVDLRTRSVTAEMVGHHGLVVAVAFWPGDAGVLASASTDGTIRLWDVGTGHCLATLDAFGERPAMSVDFTGDGRLLVAAGDAGGIFVWDLERALQRVAGNLPFQVERARHARGLPADARSIADAVAELGQRLPSASRPAPQQGAVDAATIGRWGLAAESRRGSR